ncbi:hypothetical protein PHISCL_02904 [Aspergillus sclerotialis]|uniref:F-box domain-containing protein n=1 Tax=Aspergillus sclerotialis TaxID=2070753 RepID=A0A3A2ZNE7_9EURO|nr:hypothetical protein PHISCL_02904 [Aspergillus sclerotialis]
MYMFRRKQKPNPLLNLPEDILCLIYSELPLLDKVCFSLSSKTLFNIFGSVVKHKEFEFPRLYISWIQTYVWRSRE